MDRLMWTRRMVSPGTITFQVDISQSPRQIMRFDDSGEPMTNVPWLRTRRRWSFVGRLED